MNKFIHILSALTICFILASQNASGAQTFTNSDLDRYKATDSITVSPEKSASPQKDVSGPKASTKASAEKSKKYWCSKATSLRAKVDRAKSEVEDAERSLRETETGSVSRKTRSSSEKRHKSAEKKVRSAKKALYSSEQDLNALEQEAHRQNVPPGWLRCQFSY